MYSKVLKVCNYETSTSLLPEKAVTRRYMSWKIGNNGESTDFSSKNKTNSELPSILRFICPSQETLKMKTKIRNIEYNCLGTRLYISTRDTLYFLNTQLMSLEHTLSVKSTTLIVHPKCPDTFALLVQGSSTSKPSVKVFQIKNKQSKALKPEILTMCTVTSAFVENWYSGCWSLDGKYMALVDRDDVLQVIEFGDSYRDQNLTEVSSVKLDSEAYGLIYTKDYLVVHRVDGHIQVFSQDLKESFIERAHSHIVTASAFDKNYNLLATGGSDHVVNIFDIDSGMVCIGTFPRLEGQVSSLSFSKDGNLLAWGTKDSAPCPLDEVNTLVSTLESSQNATHETEDVNTPEFYLTVSGVDPCEIYYQHNTPSPVTHVTFSPSKYVIAYACDYDSFPKSPPTNHNNLIGFLYL